VQTQSHLRSFDTFVRDAPAEALELSVDDLLPYCRKRPDVQQLIKDEIGALPEHGEIGKWRAK
jgi:hypothetical protein